MEWSLRGRMVKLPTRWGDMFLDPSEVIFIEPVGEGRSDISVRSGRLIRAIELTPEEVYERLKYKPPEKDAE